MDRDVAKPRKWISALPGLFVGRFRQWALLPEFCRRLKKHFAEAVMGATLSGLLICVIGLLFSVPHWVWLLILVGAFFFSSYAAWREEYLKPAVNEVKPIQSTDWGSRTLTFWMSPEHRAQQEHTRAIQEQVRESHRERVPEVFAIVRRVALSSVGQGCTIEMALELTNSGADTRLQDWRVIFDLPNGEQRTVTTFASGDAVPSVSANQRRPVNLATYSELVRRGAHIVGWLACSADKAVAEATKPPKVEAFDDLGNQIRVLWNPRQSGGR